MKGRITGILLLLCLVAPIAATFTFLHYRRKQVRKEVKHQLIEGIDKAELVLLKFIGEEDQTKIQWVHSKEFKYNQEMYDIVDAKIQGDTVYYWCWWDNKETKLNKQLDNLLNRALGKDPRRREHQKRLTSFYKSLYFEQVHTWHLCLLQSEQTSPDYQFNFLSVSYPPPVPPPQIG